MCLSCSSTRCRCGGPRQTWVGWLAILISAMLLCCMVTAQFSMRFVPGRDSYLKLITTSQKAIKPEVRSFQVSASHLCYFCWLCMCFLCYMDLETHNLPFEEKLSCITKCRHLKRRLHSYTFHCCSAFCICTEEQAN